MPRPRARRPGRGRAAPRTRSLTARQHRADDGIGHVGPAIAGLLRRHRAGQHARADRNRLSCADAAGGRALPRDRAHPPGRGEPAESCAVRQARRSRSISPSSDRRLRARCRRAAARRRDTAPPRRADPGCGVNRRSACTPAGSAGTAPGRTGERLVGFAWRAQAVSSAGIELGQQLARPWSAGRARSRP